MQWARLVLILLLSVTVPVYGAAALNIVERKPCPLQSADSASAMKASTHPCCQDSETAAKTGKPCKSGQECGTGTLSQIIPLKFSSPKPARHLVLPVVNTHFPSCPPSGVWRPPAAL
jgi:hypothetical protein